MARPSIHYKQQRLVDILVEMIHSALAWEEGHGRPLSTLDSESESLTTGPEGVHLLQSALHPSANYFSRGDVHDNTQSAS